MALVCDPEYARAVAGAALLGSGSPGAATAQGHHADTGTPSSNANGSFSSHASDPGYFADSVNRDLDAMARGSRVQGDTRRTLDPALDTARAGDGQEDGDDDALAVQAVTDLGWYLGEILAVIHGDGGHRLMEVGPEQATEEAIAKWHHVFRIYADTIDIPKAETASPADYPDGALLRRPEPSYGGTEPEEAGP